MRDGNTSLTLCPQCRRVSSVDQQRTNSWGPNVVSRSPIWSPQQVEGALGVVVIGKNRDDWPRFKWVTVSMLGRPTPGRRSRSRAFPYLGGEIHSGHGRSNADRELQSQRNDKRGIGLPAFS